MKAAPEVFLDYFKLSSASRWTPAGPWVCVTGNAFAY
jgi:hypothetical protein